MRYKKLFFILILIILVSFDFTSVNATVSTVGLGLNGIEGYKLFKINQEVTKDDSIIGISVQFDEFFLQEYGFVDEIFRIQEVDFDLNGQELTVNSTDISDSAFNAKYNYTVQDTYPMTELCCEADLTSIFGEVIDSSMVFINISRCIIVSDHGTIMLIDLGGEPVNGYKVYGDFSCSEPTMTLLTQEPIIYNEFIEIKLEFEEDVIIDVNKMEFQLASGDWRKDVILIDTFSPREYIVGTIFDERLDIIVNTSIEFSPNSVLDNRGNSFSGSAYPKNRNVSYRAYYPELDSYQVTDEYIKLTFADINANDGDWILNGFISDQEISGVAYDPVIIDASHISKTEDLYIVTLNYTEPFMNKVLGKDGIWYFYFEVFDPDGNVINASLENIELDLGPPVVSLTPLFDEQYKQYLPFEVTDLDIELIDLYIKSQISGQVLCDLRLWYRNIKNRSLIFNDAYMDNYDLISQAHVIGNVDTEEISEYMMIELLEEPLSTGPYLLEATARDSNQNTSEPVSVEFYLDQSPPELFIIEDDSTVDLERFEVQVVDIDGHIPSVNRTFEVFYDFVTETSDYILTYSNSIQVINMETGFIDIPYDQLTEDIYYLVCYTKDYADNYGSSISGVFEVPEKPTFTVDGEVLTNDLMLELVIDTQNDKLQYQVVLNDFSTEWQLLSESPLVEFDSLNEGFNELSVQVREAFAGDYLVSDLKVHEFYYDTTPPTCDIVYSETGYTVGPVIASIENIFDEYSDNVIVRLQGSDSLICELNYPDEIWTYELIDEAGNVAYLNAQADWISTTARQAYAIYDKTPTSDFILIDLLYVLGSGKPELRETENVEIVNGMFKITENGSYSLKYQDDFGEIGSVFVRIDHIDRKIPEYEVRYSTNKNTNRDVIAYVQFDEQVTIKETGDTYLVGHVLDYTFTENALVTLTAVDLVGLETKFDLEVDYIDRTPLELYVEYSDNYYLESTKDEVTVMVTANKPFELVNNRQLKSKTFVRNNHYTFIGEDAYGNTDEISVDISNINSRADVEVVFDPSEPTNGNVLVSLEGDEPISVLYSDETILATENMSGSFYIKDARENVFHVPFEVKNIDKTPPTISFERNHIYIPLKDTFTVPDDAKIIDNFDGEIEDYDVVHNVNPKVKGVYHIDYTCEDAVGNIASIRRNVYVVEKVTVVINGRQTIEGLMTYDTHDLSIQVINTEGDFILKYSNGRVSISHFKTENRTIIDLISFNKNGYITLYLLDQERNSKFIELYLYE